MASFADLPIHLQNIIYVQSLRMAHQESLAPSLRVVEAKEGLGDSPVGCDAPCCRRIAHIRDITADEDVYLCRECFECPVN